MPNSQDAFAGILRIAGTVSAKVPPAAADGATASYWLTPEGRVRTYNSRRNRLGTYYANGGTFALAAAADTATGGRMWLVNDSSTRIIAIRRALWTSAANFTAVAANTTQFTVQRMTYTGTPTGAVVAAAKIDSLMPDPTGRLTLASTGMTITAGPIAKSFESVAILTVVGTSTPVEQLWVAGDEDEYLILRQKEGIVLRQSTAGVAADVRTGRLDILWEEYPV